MKKRNPLAVFGLSIITLGIYDLYWLVVTKKELNAKTKVHVPSIWLLLSPLLVIIIGFIVLIATGISGNSNATTNNVNYSYSVNSATTKTASTTSGGQLVGLTLYVIAIPLIIFISFYWFFKYSKAVNEYTNGKSSTGLTFILLWVLHLIGVAIVQDAYNDVIDAGGSNSTSAFTGSTPPNEPSGQYQDSATRQSISSPQPITQQPISPNNMATQGQYQSVQAPAQEPQDAPTVQSDGSDQPPNPTTNNDQNIDPRI